MDDNVSELYNKYLETFFHEHKAFSDAQKINLGHEYDPINLFLETYNHDVWFEKEVLTMRIQERVIKKNMFIDLTCHH